MRYNNFKRYCRNYQDIENYEKALADDFIGWECHHRLETHAPDGKRRDVDIPREELKALGMYYHRPAEELIFLQESEHKSFQKGKKRSAETRRKISEAVKGKPKTEEHKSKLSESHKGKQVGEKHPMYGKKHSAESIQKMSEAHKGHKYNLGRHWYNNGKVNTMSKECPDGFVPGRIKKP